MVRIPEAGDGSRRSDDPIYEPAMKGASDAERSSSARELRARLALRVATGMGLGVACWHVLAALGAHDVAGVSALYGVPWFAALGGAIGLTRLRTLLALGTMVLLAFLALVAWTGAFNPLALRLIRSDRPVTVDAVVVLSAGMDADGRISSQGVDRLLRGIELVQAGVAPRIVVTTEQRQVGDEQVVSSGDQNRLTAIGRVGEVIATEPVTSTREEALRVLRVARERGWRRIGLVTSAFHSRRACATFEHAGLAVTCLPAESREVALGRLGSPGERVDAFAALLYETAGTLRYKQKGWL